MRHRHRRASAVVGTGVLDDVAMIFGGHIDRHYPLGTIIVSDGAVNASSDSFSMEGFQGFHCLTLFAARQGI